MKYLPKKSFTWILVAFVIYGYVSYRGDDGAVKQIKEIPRNIDVSVKSVNKEGGLLDKPLNFLMNKIKQTETGGVVVNALVAEALKKKYGKKDITMIQAIEKDKVLVMDRIKGEGKSASCNSTVTVHYEGFVDGQLKFDSTRTNKPLTFRIGKGQVIKGLEAGIIGMKKGGKRKIVMPARFAYYNQEFINDAIKKESVPAFEVELLKLKGGNNLEDIMVTGDIFVGDGEKELFCGDRAKLKYKLLENKQSIKEGTLDLKLGDNNVPIGLERGLLGMKKNGIRNLTIPSSLLKTKSKSVLQGEEFKKRDTIFLEVELVGMP